jgi:polysaccharide deacetylase 2 family uncharacterized protein YibQ
VRRWRLLLLCLLLPLPAAADTARLPPAISIIIDDIGHRLEPGQRAIGLPGPVACAFLPYAPYSAALADAARRGGKEALLHLPMQAADGTPLDPGAVTMDMDKSAFLDALRQNLAAVPHAVGVNNHMGSLLTRHPGHMTWLMQELKGRGNLFFVDSRTSDKTVAEQIAIEQGVPVLRRHVFLDHDPTPAAVAAQFDRLLAQARRQGGAVAIGHPYASTLTLLEQRLPGLKAEGVELIPLREMIARQRENRSWRASLSR